MRFPAIILKECYMQSEIESAAVTECEPTEEELLISLETVIETLDPERGGLIPALQSAQNLFGYLPESAMRMISERMGISYSEVAGVVSFYKFFSTSPRGKYLIRVCLGTSCYVRGGKEVLNELMRILGVKVGESTQDRFFSLEVGRCFGACGLAPVVMINDDIYRRVKPSKIEEILKQYREAEADNE